MTAADPRDGLRAKCPRCGDNDPLATQVSVDSCRSFKYAVMTCRCGHGEVAAYYDDDRSLQDLSDKFYRIAHARPEAVDDLRNKVAIAALQGLLSNPGGPVQANANTGTGFCNCNAEEVAGWALDIANAMIATLTPERAP